jgi:CDP-4-dehydro-6-deoxyglucose reductase, E3
MPKRFQASVISKTEIAKDIWVVRLQTERDVEYVPGQYVSIRVTPTGVRRSYSVSQVIETDDGWEIDLLVDVSPMGMGSRFILAVKVGSEIDVLGYMGHFVVGDEISDVENLCFVATGTGIAPIRAMIEDVLKRESKKIKLVWGVKHKSSLYWTEIWEDLSRQYDNFEYTICLSRESEPGYVHGHVQEALSGMEDTMTDRVYYLCGLSEMVEEVAMMLLDRGVAESHIVTERYT